VLVIGYKEWQRRFGGDPAILGTTVRLDETVHTIVGVMPEGFAFPLGHQYWVPLRVTETTPMPGVELEVFGRLAPGFTLAQARAELAAIADRKAAASPQSPRPERPQLSAYNQAFMGIRGPEMELAVRAIRIGIGLLVLIVAVNVAILVYARTATRSGEIAVRTALGASRVRVVAQLFVEALVMSVASAALGLTVAGAGLRVFRDYASQDTDKGGWAAGFATAFHLSPSVVLYVAVLAILAAIVVGVIPALQATGRRVHAGLQQFSARGSGMQLGRTWTALIVMQVAIAVAALPAAMYRAEGSFSAGMRAPSPVAASLLAGRLSMSGSAGAAPLRAARMTALLERIGSEPDVAGVTFATAFPGHEAWRTMEAEGDARSEPIDVQWNRVAINCFDVFGIRIVAGRGFDAADARPAASAVIVDQLFAEQLAPGASVIGRRIRFTRPEQDAGATVNPWSEIVGVVPAFTQSFTAPMGFSDPLPRVYYAAAAGAEPRASLIVRLKNGSTGSPAQVAQRLSETAASVHPSLKLEEVQGVVQVWEHDQEAMRLVAIAIIAVTASVLLLSAAGIYAMMSFTVARRRREIGIRAALGADARRVLMGIFGRAGAQLGGGTLAGLAIAVGLDRLDPGSLMGDRALVLLPSVVAVMFVVGLLAALGPARRGLSVQPTEALRED
jgi:predicted permease